MRISTFNNISIVSHMRFSSNIRRLHLLLPIRMSIKRKIVILAVSLLGTEIAWKVWKYLINKRRRKCVSKENLQLDLMAEVLMFSENSARCRDHANTRIPCDKSDCAVRNVGKIQRHLSGAFNTIDFCMYLITCEDLTNAIVTSHRRGIRARVIVDSGMSDVPACNSQLLRMLRAGIEVRTNGSQPTSIMHHKFALIDGRILLLGSANWTMAAFYGNNDAVIVTNNAEFLMAYSREFERMWNAYER